MRRDEIVAVNQGPVDTRPACLRIYKLVRFFPDERLQDYTLLGSLLHWESL